MRNGIFKRAVCLVTAMASVLCVSSCSRYAVGDDFYAGKTVTPEDIESLYAAVAAQNGEGDETAEPVTAPTESQSSMIVYWTAGGSTYHLYPECRHYAKSSEKRTGTLDVAIKSGKKNMCSVCKKQSETENNDITNTPKGEDVYDIP